MTAGAFGRLPRAALIACAFILLSATITWAAGSTMATPETPAAAPTAPEPQALVVPDVRKQAYVFAKGSLEQEGFAWRVEGGVPGFAANVVASQSPVPGTKVVPDGAPIVVLRLSRNPSYPQEGTPENVSPYPGKPARLVGAEARKTAAKKQAAPAKAAAAAPKPAAKPKATPAAKPSKRTPAFAVPGAPKEPLDEITLAARATQLAAWVEAHPQPSDANVNHWLFQHNWIVTGARFGWSTGEEALRTLVAVDARVEQLWGVGARSKELAQRSLTEVEAKSS